MKRVKVGVLGATGAVGQRFVQLLENHPWFEVTSLCASEKSAGKVYKEAASWRMSTKIPPFTAKLKVGLCKPTIDAKIVFSGLDSSVAGEIEDDFAGKGYVVVSNSKNHRMEKDVPLLIPEVNPDHLSLIKAQQKRRKSKGFIITNPNCTTVGLAMVLKPLNDAFKIKSASVTSMQALSGAGYPGVASLDAVDNVIPFIGGEEEKVETEPLKLLGSLKKGQVVFAPIKISASCNRVAVRDGHIESVELAFAKKPKVNDVIKVLSNFKGVPQQLKLPSAPKNPIVVTLDETRPQPVLDRDTENGMTVTVGRIRKSNVADIKLTLIVHNTIRGAAGAAILNAELLKAKGLIN